MQHLNLSLKTCSSRPHVKENNHSNYAYIAFGSNLNDPHLQIKTALDSLREFSEVVKKSGIYETVPIGGPSGQPQFLNSVALIKISDNGIQPMDLLSLLNKIEEKQGRVRKIRWEAKVIDLDILTFNDEVINTEKLILPHLLMMEREFVLAPFAEILPEWQHPVTKQSAVAALELIKGQGVRRTELEW